MNEKGKKISLIGSASGVAAAFAGTADGPLVLQNSSYLNDLERMGLTLEWRAMLQPMNVTSPNAIFDTVLRHNQDIAAVVADLVKNKQFFTVFGGDHSCAIGTWSGVAAALHREGNIGLIWVDAHLDSHTFETSETGNIHGMPLACLLGEGDPSLTGILTSGPKIQPNNVCVIGARSYEAGEVATLNKLNVRIYYMEEVEQRGLDVIMDEAIALAKDGTVAFGVTIDIDSVDPREAPGTGVSEPGGLSGQDLCRALTKVSDDEKLIGVEIVEFDPHLDKYDLTEKLVVQVFAALTLGKIIQI